MNEVVGHSSVADIESLAAPLQRPLMGTESIGPLLHALIRMTRPERVLEVGAGATTIYLLHALECNHRIVQKERMELKQKQQYFDPAWDKLTGLRHRSLVLEWLAKPPALALAAFYDEEYEPSLVSVDLEVSESSAAAVVESYIKSAGLGSRLESVTADFRDLAPVFAQAETRFDLMWFDCGGAKEYREFLEGYWPLLSEDGGLMILHFTESVAAHEVVISDFVESQRLVGCNLEVLSLSEPHKIMQNSCTILRRVGTPRRYPLTTYVRLG